MLRIFPWVSGRQCIYWIFDKNLHFLQCKLLKVTFGVHMAVNLNKLAVDVLENFRQKGNKIEHSGRILALWMHIKSMTIRQLLKQHGMKKEFSAKGVLPTQSNGPPSHNLVALKCPKCTKIEHSGRISALWMHLKSMSNQWVRSKNGLFGFFFATPLQPKYLY